eukprot:136428-Chlamydomonas_euryale.AAC.2
MRRAGGKERGQLAGYWTSGFPPAWWPPPTRGGGPPGWALDKQATRGGTNWLGIGKAGNKGEEQLAWHWTSRQH